VDLTVAKQFIIDVLATMGDKLWAIEPWNEPNHPIFDQAADDPNAYAAYYMMFYNAIQEYNTATGHSIRVLAGSLAYTGNFKTWLTSLNNLPSDGTAVHAYQGNINTLPEVESQTNKPVYVTESGNPASDPSQMADNLRSNNTAHCAGVKYAGMYQLVRTPSKDWNYGVIDAPPAQ
jgi:hypothetical protein